MTQSLLSERGAKIGHATFIEVMANGEEYRLSLLYHIFLTLVLSNAEHSETVQLDRNGQNKSYPSDSGSRLLFVLRFLCSKICHY